MDNLEIIAFQFQRSIPEIIAWCIGIILAIIMLRRGGKKPEILLLLGCSLFLLSTVSSLIITSLVQWGHVFDMSAVGFGLIITFTSGLLSLAGFVCLVWGFWTKFRKRGVSPP